MAHPHDCPPNGTGGSAGTHEGHADRVFGDRRDQTVGNRAAQQAEQERGTK